MRFLDFQKQFKQFNLISYQNIKNAFGAVNNAQLSFWKNKGYLTSIRKGMYVLSDTKIDRLLLANEINDSYISLESALSYHQVIPEITQSITSVSKNRQEEVSNSFGTFYYHKISPKLFTGFVLIESMVRPRHFIRIAEIEKAIFDLVYFRHDLKNYQDFDALRLNLAKFKITKFKQYADLVKTERIKNRINNFIKYYASI